MLLLAFLRLTRSPLDTHGQIDLAFSLTQPIRACIVRVCVTYRAEGKEKLLGKKRRSPKLEALETCDFKGILFHLLSIID